MRHIGAGTPTVMSVRTRGEAGQRSIRQIQGVLARLMGEEQDHPAEGREEQGQPAQGEIAHRYAEALRQLDSGQLEVRLGGIYALESLARESARDHPAAMRTLAAFIRERTRGPLPWPGAAAPERVTARDVQAALAVIGRRDARHDRGRINLRRADLSRARLTGANLAGARLSGANLTGTNLTGANLRRARLSRADLTGANLTRARLSRARLTGARLSVVNLAGADLTRANLTDAHLNIVNLTGADLTGADLTGANLFHADLTGAGLSRARYPEAEQVPPGWTRSVGSGRLRHTTGDPRRGPSRRAWPART
jgi:uncharacterized protein YjbI with pentapeptide repeats